MHWGSFLLGFLTAYLIAGVGLAILASWAFAAVDPPREPSWQCPICQREFASREILARHRRLHGKTVPRVLREAREIVEREIGG